MIASTATALGATLNNLQIQLAKLRSQKRGLMQKLLAGEWRLDESFE
jgi:hypothetical protein